MNTNQTLTGPGGIAARLAPSVAAVASQLAESNEMPEALVREMRDSGALRLLTPTELGGTEAARPVSRGAEGAEARFAGRGPGHR